MTREQPVTFGDQDVLSGILLRPEATAGGLGFLFLSAGLVHRVGPNRLHVTLARDLGDLGVPSLRFDFSGIGESGTRADRLTHADRILSEARAAMDTLEREADVSRFVVFGICSGADNGLRIACADHRVAGAILVEGYAWDSFGYDLAQLLRKALSLKVGGRLLQGGVSLGGVVARLLSHSRRAAAPPRTEGATDALERRPADEVVGDLVKVAQRTGRVLLIYSRHGVSYHNYRRLFRRRASALEAKNELRVEVLAGANHTFGPLAVQTRFCEIVREWTSALLRDPGPEAGDRPRVHGAQAVELGPRLT